MNDPAVLVYDGDCGLCQQCVGVVRRLRPRRVRIVAYQSTDLGFFGLSAEQCAAAVQWVEPDGPRSSGGQAIADCLRRCPAPWSWAGTAMTLPGIASVRDVVYGLVARNRHRWPFGPVSCPRPEA